MFGTGFAIEITKFTMSLKERKTMTLTSLWQKMVKKFGPGSAKECCYPDEALERARYEEPAKRFACYCEKCAGTARSRARLHTVMGF